MSKRVTKLLSLILTLVMFLSVTTPAFAFGGGDGLGDGWDRDIGEEEIRDFTDPVVEEEEEVDYFSASDASGVAVTVEAPMGALPTLAEVRAERVEAEEIRDAVESVVDGEPNILLALDISFWLYGREIEPELPVRVKIAAPELENKTNLTLVHIPDAAEPETVNLLPEEDLSFALGTNEIAFESSSFSVYAIVDPVDDGPARDTYVFQTADGNPFLFYNDASDQVDNQIIKDGEYLEDVGLPTILANQTFLGWFLYDTETGTFGEKIEFGAARDVAQGANHTFYVRPKYDTVVYLTFYNNAEGTIIKDRVQVVITSGENVTYDLTTKDATPPNGNLAFVGWAENLGDTDPIAEATAKAYPVTKNQNFFPVFKSSHWMSYWTAEAGAGATYIAPSHVLVGHKASETLTTEVPKVKGYTFRYWTTQDQSGNWTKVEGQDKWVYNVPTTNPPQFNPDQELSADITLYAVWENAQSSYRVIIWHQSIEDDKDATEKSYEQFSQDLRTEAATETVYTTTADRTAPVGFVYNAEKSDTFAVVKADGSTVLNVYFDRKLITMNFSGIVQYTEVTDHPSSATRYWYKDSSGSWTQGYFRYYNEKWQIDSTPTGYYYTWVDFDGVPYERTTTTKQYTGLYGQPLSKYNYEWPEGTWSYANSQGGTTGMSYLGQFVLPTGVADSSGTVINFTATNGNTTKVDFYLQNNTDIVGETRTYPSSPNDTGYVERGGTFSFSEKYDGYFVTQYRLYTESANGTKTYYHATYNAGRDYWSMTQNSEWVDCEVSNTPGKGNVGLFGYIGNNGTYFHLEIRYALKDYAFKYLDSIDGQEILTSIRVYYGASLEDYKPTAEQEAGLVSQTPGKQFDGKWYKDQACQTQFDWTATMPNSDYQAYAGWEDIWYWAKVDPDGGVINEETTGATWFWNTYGEPVIEYNFVKREYVESDTGTYYYHNHQLPHPMTMTWEETDAERQKDPSYAYYTTDSSLSLDGGKKYAYVENAYDLIGWYIVDMETGETTDELFNFDAPMISNVWIRAKWHRNGDFPIYYSALGVDKNGNILKDENDVQISGTNAPTDVARYDDGANSAMLIACDAPQGYVFLGWYYAGKVYDPGEKFVVDAAQANEEGQIVIYAAYEKIDSVPVRVTHITWYDNFTENPASPANYKTVDDLQINKAIAIESSTLFSRYGYKFIGWARVETTDSQGNALDGYELAPRELGKDDLYLTWHEADDTHQDGYFTVNHNGEDKEVTEVAADEIFPYHDMYAVWEKSYFYVYHTSDCEVQRIEMPTAETDVFDLTKLVRQNYLYGGYYSAYAGASFTTDSPFDPTKITSFPYTDSNGKAYDPANVKFLGADAYTKNGKAMTPVAGTLYYLKEVPNTYLMPTQIEIYNRYSKDLRYLILTTAFDDNNYGVKGFTVNGETITDIHLVDQIKITFGDNSDETNVDLDASDVASVQAGLVLYHILFQLPYNEETGFDMTAYGPILNDGAALSKVVKPFWTTPDGLTVTGSGLRRIIIKDMNTDNRIQADGKEIQYRDFKSVITVQLAS